MPSQALQALFARAWAWTTVSRIAVGLVVIASVAVVLDISMSFGRAWWPNVAVSALTIALTITLVNRIALRDAQMRLAPRLKLAYADVAERLQSFALVVAREYATTHDDAHYRRPPCGVAAILEHWLEQVVSASLPHDQRDSAIAAGGVLATGLDAVRIANLDVLEPNLTAAMDECSRLLRQRSELWGQLQGLNVHADPAEAVAYTTHARPVVETVLAFATAFAQWTDVRPELDESILESLENLRPTLIALLRIRN